jgi:hypothetical protein
MGVGLQDKLNKFQFERTVDWRVKFPSLFREMRAMGGQAAKIANLLTGPDLSHNGGILYDGYLFAQSCEFTPGMVTYKQDQQAGYYNSNLSFPDLKMTLYTDAGMLIEQALQIWCMSGFMTDGTMPVNLDSASIAKYKIVNPVQEIEVQRIAPFNVTRAFLGLLYDAPGQGAMSMIDLDRNKIKYNDTVRQWYSFKAYLQAEPKFSGTAESAGFRTAALICNVVGFERGNPLTVGQPDRATDRAVFNYAVSSGSDPETAAEALGFDLAANATSATRGSSDSWVRGR